MSAAIVTDYTRKPVNPHAKLYRDRRCDADLTRCALDPHIPGQLWERVAKGLTASRRLGEALDRSRARNDNRGPAIAHTIPYVGVIRAGVRVK